MVQKFMAAICKDAIPALMPPYGKIFCKGEIKLPVMAWHIFCAKENRHAVDRVGKEMRDHSDRYWITKERKKGRARSSESSRRWLPLFGKILPQYDRKQIWESA